MKKIWQNPASRKFLVDLIVIFALTLGAIAISHLFSSIEWKCERMVRSGTPIATLTPCQDPASRFRGMSCETLIEKGVWFGTLNPCAGHSSSHLESHWVAEAYAYFAVLLITLVHWTTFFWNGDLQIFADYMERHRPWKAVMLWFLVITTLIFSCIYIGIDWLENYEIRLFEFYHPGHPRGGTGLLALMLNYALMVLWLFFRRDHYKARMARELGAMQPSNSETGQ